MGGLKKRRWLLRGLAVCMAMTAAVYLGLHVGLAIGGASDLDVEVLGGFRKREGRFESDQNRMMLLLSEDDNTSLRIPWPDTATTVLACEKLRYYSYGPLPSASVIITFHETETVSLLLHTIHSVVQRTPRSLLKEVIVIDDYSRKDDHGQILEIYMKIIFPEFVKLYRNSKNLGLIRSRLKGSRLSQGDVIVFMDSHSEVQTGWLEPLLYEIKKNPKTLVQSQFDWMEKKDDGWYYTLGGSSWIVYFDWRLVFGWQEIPKQQESIRNITDPVRSKVIIGTYAAIDRRFFVEIGELDEGLEFWGGENIELSLRVWLFGGQILSIPCSRVAHREGQNSRVYRHAFMPVIDRNYKRVVEVWFDEYKSYFYLYYPELLTVDPGNLTERIKLKSKATYNFTWFLQNVFPELGLPDKDSFGWGNLRNPRDNVCLECQGINIALLSCSSSYAQIFYWSKKYELRQPINIFNVVMSTNNVTTTGALAFQQYIQFYGNDFASKWLHWKNGPLIESQTQLCLTVSKNRMNVVLNRCDYENNPNQIWEFQHYTEAYERVIIAERRDWRVTDPRLYEELTDRIQKLMKSARKPTTVERSTATTSTTRQDVTTLDMSRVHRT